MPADRYDPATVALVAATLESTLSKPIPGVAVAVLDALTTAGWRDLTRVSAYHVVGKLFHPDDVAIFYEEHGGG
jgi:hypothetical protein